MSREFEPYKREINHHNSMRVSLKAASMLALTEGSESELSRNNKDEIDLEEGSDEE